MIVFSFLEIIAAIWSSVICCQVLCCWPQVDLSRLRSLLWISQSHSTHAEEELNTWSILYLCQNLLNSLLAIITKCDRPVRQWPLLYQALLVSEGKLSVMHSLTQRGKISVQNDVTKNAKMSLFVPLCASMHLFVPLCASLRLFAPLCASLCLVAPHHPVLNAKFQPITVHES